MPRLLACLPIAVVLAGALSSCHNGGSKKSADAQVRDVVKQYGAASARKDYQTICDRLISTSLSDNVEQFGLPCELAFKQGLDEVVSPKVRVDLVKITGDRAEVRVHSTAANQTASDDTMALRKESGTWRIAALTAVPKPKRPPHLIG